MLDQHISMETERLVKLKEDEDFYTKVTKILSRGRRVDFIKK